jgi:UDP-galactopyranose mutase
MHPSAPHQDLPLTGKGVSGDPYLICFSHLRWDFVFQRPQHLLTRAATSYRVIYIEEPVHADIPDARLDLRRADGGVEVAVPVLPNGISAADALAVQRRLVDELLAVRDRGLTIFWYYTPMALDFTDPSRADVVVYDNMDELSAFRGAPPALLQNEQKLMAAADLVFTGGVSLYEAKKGRHPHLHAFPSSIDTAHFAAARGSVEEAPDQATIAHPRIGFFGVIDERMDVELVGALAVLRPAYQFVMIGPVVKIDPADLPQAPNIHWLGGRTYRDLPAYLAGWDAGFMPFALNESTRFISPTKTPEFLAAGIPVVSTEITDVVRPYGTAGLVEIEATASAMAEAVDRLLARPREAWLESVDAFLSTTSWDRVFAEMNGLIETAAEASHDVAPPRARAAG